MPSSGTLCLVALLGTDVSEERSASIIRATRIGEVGTASVGLQSGSLTTRQQRGLETDFRYENLCFMFV
jgi:hypothetical protein